MSNLTQNANKYHAAKKQTLCFLKELIFRTFALRTNPTSNHDAVQNGHHNGLPQQDQHQWLSSPLSVSLSTKHCLTNEMQIVKTAIIKPHMTGQLGWLGSCCSVFSYSIRLNIHKRAANCPTNILKYNLYWPWYSFISPMRINSPCLCLSKTFKMSCQNIFLQYIFLRFCCKFMWQPGLGFFYPNILHFLVVYLLRIRLVNCQ